MNKSALNITNNNFRNGSTLHLQQADITKPVCNHQNFEQLYLLLRAKENRIYTDEELLNLPNIDKNHPHHKEWLVRKHSFNKLKHYLKNKKKSLEILEIGCGNGWLSNQLSMHVNCRVIGLDINRSELEQAASVFQDNTACTFIYGDIFSGLLNQKKFDIILFAASVQYFPSLRNVLNTALQLLKTGGEIHIIDTHFYRETALAEAYQRSKSHFASLGFPEMSIMYFHHSLNEINDLHPFILYDPLSLRNRFFKSKAPFYRICISKD